MEKVERKKLVIKISNIFARLQYKINFNINNTSTLILPTDVLRNNSKRKLFKIATQNIETAFYSLIEDKDIPQLVNYQPIFFSLVKQTTEEFLTSSYGYNTNICTSHIKESFYTSLLLEDEQIFINIPLQILLNEESSTFRSTFIPIYSKVYESFIEAFFDNLVVELTNSVASILVNEFSFIYEIRKNLYRSNFLSLRNIERFQNNLSWQIRVKRFVTRPADLYNSQQGIWIIRTTGIYYRVVYANRTSELLKLKKFALITLIVIETKDFFISRVDEVLYFVGNIVRYTFTSILGQVIGLVWRGIIEGLKK